MMMHCPILRTDVTIRVVKPVLHVVLENLNQDIEKLKQN